MKLITCIAEMYFDQKCPLRPLIPKHAKMKIPSTLPAANLWRKISKTIRKIWNKIYLY